MTGRTDGRTKYPLYSTGHCPSGAAALLTIGKSGRRKKSRARVLLTIYWPRSTILMMINTDILPLSNDSTEGHFLHKHQDSSIDYGNIKIEKSKMKLNCDLIIVSYSCSFLDFFLYCFLVLLTYDLHIELYSLDRTAFSLLTSDGAPCKFSLLLPFMCSQTIWHPPTSLYSSLFCAHKLSGTLALLFTPALSLLTNCLAPWIFSLLLPFLSSPIIRHPGSSLYCFLLFAHKLSGTLQLLFTSALS